MRTDSKGKKPCREGSDEEDQYYITKEKAACDEEEEEGIRGSKEERNHYK